MPGLKPASRRELVRKLRHARLRRPISRRPDTRRMRHDTVRLTYSQSAYEVQFDPASSVEPEAGWVSI